MSYSVLISPTVLIEFLGLTSSFFEGLSFCNALSRLVRTTSVKFIGLFPQYDRTKRCAIDLSPHG